MKVKTIVENRAFRVMCFRITSGFIHSYQPKKLFLFTVDNWFGAKWLKFSGKILGALGLWQNKITVPPFNPNRIEYETHFERLITPDEKVIYNRINNKIPVHVFIPSAENMNRRLTQFTTDGIFIWESANTDQNDYGSLMVYLIKDTEVWTWYVQFKKYGSNKDKWEIDQTVGISKEEVERYLEIGKNYGMKVEYQD